MPGPPWDAMVASPLNRRSFLRAGATLAVVPFLEGASSGFRDPPQGTINLIDGLTVDQRADALSGANNLDLTARIRSLIAAASPGTTIDATMLRGTMRLSGNIFDGIVDAPVTLRTGGVTFVIDFNRARLTIPSRLHWHGDGTEIRPASPITSIPTDNAVAFGMVETNVIPGHCSGVRGEAQVQASNPSYTSGLNPGARIAIFGLHADTDVRHYIRGALTAQTSAFAFNENTEHTLEDSLIYLLVEDEIMLGTQRRGVFNTANLGGRGALGTTAGPHPAGAPATLLRSEIFTVAGVAGMTIMLDRPLQRSFASSQFRAGSVGSRLSGSFLVDGQFNRDNPGGLFYCLATTLSSGFRAEGDIALRRGMHGGFMGYGCQGASLDIREVSGCGRPRQTLGSSLWLFGSAQRNRIRAHWVTDGYLGYVIDNKSNGVSYYGLDGPCLDNSIEIDLLDRHVAEGEISGSSANTVLIRDSDTSEQSTIIDHGTSQATTPVAAAGNLVTVLHQRRRWRAWGDALDENRVVVNGSAQP